MELFTYIINLVVIVATVAGLINVIIKLRKAGYRSKSRELFLHEYTRQGEIEIRSEEAPSQVLDDDSTLYNASKTKELENGNKRGERVKIIYDSLILSETTGNNELSILADRLIELTNQAGKLTSLASQAYLLTALTKPLNITPDIQERLHGLIISEFGQIEELQKRLDIACQAQEHVTAILMAIRGKLRGESKVLDKEIIPERLTEKDEQG